MRCDGWRALIGLRAPLWLAKSQTYGWATCYICVELRTGGASFASRSLRPWPGSMVRVMARLSLVLDSGRRGDDAVDFFQRQHHRQTAALFKDRHAVDLGAGVDGDTRG